ncbi:MAG: L-threonylcarbamoyladenylate synthase [Cyanobacteriota bacterium]|nr:L-threonylcarbamoyladenylate synthase [Cyanobacteriota bacterium]
MNVLSTEELLTCIQREDPVLFPTDTVPALAIRPQAAPRIWELKQRPAHKPLILMGADLEQLQQVLAVPWRPEWLEEARQVWPGAVTLVLPMAGPLCEALHPGGASLGLRVPACPPTLELLHRSGPLATTSVNRSGDAPALDAEQATQFFPELCLLGPVPWPAGSGCPSEVKAWSQDGWHILRAPTSPTS